VVVADGGVLPQDRQPGALEHLVAVDELGQPVVDGRVASM